MLKFIQESRPETNESKKLFLIENLLKLFKLKNYSKGSTDETEKTRDSIIAGLKNSEELSQIYKKDELRVYECVKFFPVK